MTHRLPAAARAIAAATTNAVAAALTRDATEFAAATGALAALDPERVRLVLGAVVRSALEDLYPAGLTGDDANDVLRRCARAAIDWVPDFDVHAMVVLVTGALGIHDTEGEPEPLAPLAVARHAALLLADLLTEVDRPLAGYLRAAFAEIARAETVELP